MTWPTKRQTPEKNVHRCCRQQTIADQEMERGDEVGLLHTRKRLGQDRSSGGGRATPVPACGGESTPEEARSQESQELPDNEEVCRRMEHYHRLRVAMGLDPRGR